MSLLLLFGNSPDTAISGAELTKLRTGRHQATFYLSVLRPVTLLSALVNNGSIARGARSIAYDTGTGSAASFALIGEGQTLVVITADGEKKVRVKSIAGDESTGTIQVDENSIAWGNNQAISILHEYRIWPIAPRITGGVFYKFYDTAYSNQNSQPNPVAIAGPHRAGFLSAGSLAFAIDASDSYAIASGATISSYAWSCTGGTITNAAIATTTITFNTAGTYWLKLTVTDSNGKTQSTFRAIFVYDADNPPYTNFDVNSVTGSWQSGGYRAAFSVNGDVELSDFPDGTLVLLWYAGKINAAEDYVNLWLAGDNLLFSGYIRTDNDTDDYTTGAGTVEFSAVSPEGVLDETTEFGTVSITATAAPATWYEYASWLTVGRAVHHLLRWHSTAFSCVDIYGLTDNTLGMESASFTEQSLLQQVNSLAFNRGHFAKLASDRTGRLHFVTDSQYLNDAGRAALDTVFSIINADISGAINVTRQPEGRVGYCDLDGFSFDGSTGTAFISLAPGYIDTISISMAEFTGIGGLPVKNQVLASQTDSDEKAGRALAVENRPISEIRLEMPANYSGAFDIIPSIGWYDWGIADANLKRVLALFGSNLVCRQVENRINVSAGTIQTAVILEPEAFGADGIPGNYPTAYPARPANPPDPDWNEPVVPSDVNFIIAHFDSDNAEGQAVVGEMTGTAFALGADTMFDNGFQFATTAICGLSPTQALVCFLASSNGNAQVLDIAGNVITPGVLDVFNTGLPNWMQVEALTSVQGIVVYSDNNVDPGTSRACILDVSGSTVTAGAEATFLNDSSISASVAKLTATKVIAAYSYTGAGTRTTAVVLNISGSTITPQTPQDIGEDIDVCDICALDSTTALLVYKDASANLKVVDLTSIGNTFTVGTPVEIVSTGTVFTGRPGVKWIQTIDSSHAVIAYEDGGVINVIAVEYSGGTITAGSPVDISAGSNAFPAIALVSDTQAIVAYNTFNEGKVSSMTISGTTVTDNSDVVDFDTDEVEYISIAALRTIT